MAKLPDSFATMGEVGAFRGIACCLLIAQMLLD
jgi:hypothetical protein